MNVTRQSSNGIVVPKNRLGTTCVRQIVLAKLVFAKVGNVEMANLVRKLLSLRNIHFEYGNQSETLCDDHSYNNALRLTNVTLDQLYQFWRSRMAYLRLRPLICVVFFSIYCLLSQVKAFNECSYDSGCYSYIPKAKRYCCRRKFPQFNICKSNCLGETCILDSDCADDEHCCNEKCRTTCIGESCVWDSDCATGECCDPDDKKCTTGDCDAIKGLAGWIVAVIVISVIVVVVIPIAVAIFCCCCAAAASTRRAHGGVIVTQPATTGTTVVGTQQQNQYYLMQQGQPMYLQNSQPYPSQPPPAYQLQGMAYPPPGTAYPPTTIPPQTEEPKKQ